jgi:hypothetical protein
MNISDSIEKVRMDSIRPSEQNKEIYNGHHEDRISKLANDIKRNGLLEPLIVSTDNVIISGHTRYKALKQLKRTFVKIRRANISSDHPAFSKLLVAANNQRVKTDDERGRELKVEVDPEAYFRNKSFLNRFGDTDLKQVEGSLKKSRTLSDNYADIVKAVKKIMEENKVYLPITLRAIHYQLLNDPPILSKRKGKRYTNTRADYQRLSEIVTKMRVNKIIPFEWITDGTRKYNRNRGWDDVYSYQKYQLRYFLQTYQRDLVQTQPAYIAIICEKETISNTVDGVATEYGVPVLYTKGISSVDARFRLVKDWERNGEKERIILLILSDLDPAGFRIQDSFVGSLKSDFPNMAAKIEAYRVGVTLEQVKKYNLFSDMNAKKSDSNYKDFVKRTGLTKAYELDALKPTDLSRELDEAVMAVIDTEKYNEEVKRYYKEIDIITATRQKVVDFIGAEK